MVDATKRLHSNNPIVVIRGEIDIAAFEERNRNWININYDNIESKRNAFQETIQRQEKQKESERSHIEGEAADLIRKFKNPSEEITLRFKDWRADVHALPEASSVNLIGEYQKLYDRLVKEDLVRHKKKFDEYLQAESSR